MKYPRIMIVALGRVNAADTDNNGLLLRNLFGTWPKGNLAQIYSSGSNGDEGFFSHYYQLGPQDRSFGTLFYRMKAESQTQIDKSMSSEAFEANKKTSSIKSLVKRLFVNTGLYELIFRPKLSAEMLSLVKEFQPDIIFAQGYNLTFTWLPVMLADKFQLPLAYYPTDDWPNVFYPKKTNFASFASSLVRRAVVNASNKLVEVASLRLAFNCFMQEEYQRRYGREFTVLMHGDVPSRFESATPLRLAALHECWLVSTGVFDDGRFPLLHDLDQACEILKAKGIQIKVTIFPINSLADSLEDANFRHIDFELCLSHEKLPGILRGADILLLLERFDKLAKEIRLSVSSKAHLFMFSGRPTIVYADPRTGIACYAEKEGWAAVVKQRDPVLLAQAIEKLATDENICKEIIARAEATAGENHDLARIQSTFITLANSIIHGARG
jgi:glycosyltransferase involved in cell wall biosynthesis